MSLTLTALPVHIQDPEGHDLTTVYLWRVPSVGDEIAILTDATAGEVIHRRWVGDDLGSYVILTIEPDGWGNVGETVRMPGVSSGELATEG